MVLPLAVSLVTLVEVGCSLAFTRVQLYLQSVLEESTGRLVLLEEETVAKE